MALHNTKGIILVSRVINESDVAADVLTETSGICSFVFKSLKKSHRRPQAILEPGSIADFSCYRKGSGTSYVSDYRIIFHPAPIAASYEKILILHLMVEIIRKTTGEGAHDAYLFSFLQKAIERLSGEGDAYTLMMFFLLHLLRHGGILPDFSQPVILTLERSCIELNFYPQELTFMKAALNGKYSNTQNLPTEAARNIIFNLLLYLEHYYSIILNGKKLLFSKSTTEISVRQSVAEVNRLLHK